MKIAILGYADQGKSAFEYWNREGNEITICDQSTSLDLPSGVAVQLGADYLANLDDFDLLIRTPALHPSDITQANPKSPEILHKVTTVTNEFFKVCPTKNIIGVTGTKGKGTTSTLIAKMLEAAGKRVHLGGNIGIPPLEMLNPPAGGDIKPSDWVVLELANFQLIDLKTSPHIAICLIVTHEHLDWHEDFEEYIAAKQQLFIHQKSDDAAIYYADNEDSHSIAAASDGVLIPYFQKPGAIVYNGQIVMGNTVICKTSELKLLGEHNWQNVCAAVTAVWQIAQDVSTMHSAITNFTGLPFRIEFRSEVNGIRYYNDSFATGQGATGAAIASIPGNKVMIIGGFDRMLNLDGLARSVINHKDTIRKILLIGASADRTAKVFENNGYSNFTFCRASTMPEIVAAATAEAQPGDAVVLSPSFASFDMFKNFEERGKSFNEAVAAL